jgi:hypothetical protein
MLDFLLSFLDIIYSLEHLFIKLRKKVLTLLCRVYVQGERALTAGVTYVLRPMLKTVLVKEVHGGQTLSSLEVRE